jgi:hypothetical protein
MLTEFCEGSDTFMSFGKEVSSNGRNGNDLSFNSSSWTKYIMKSAISMSSRIANTRGHLSATESTLTERHCVGALQPRYDLRGTLDLCQWYKGNAQLGSSTTHVRAAGTVLLRQKLPEAENAKTPLLISWQGPLPERKGNGLSISHPIHHQ